MSRPPTAHEVEKLAAMTKANHAELEAIKSLRAAGKEVPRRRVIVLMRNVKAQGRLERELARRTAKAAPGQEVKSGCLVRSAMQEERAASGAGSTIAKIAADVRGAK